MKPTIFKKSLRPWIWSLLCLMLCAVLPDVADAQTVNRGPYLQSGTPSSMVVRWRTNTSTQSVVRYGTVQGTLTSTATTPGTTTEHIVTISGLSSDTKYFYSVGNTAGALAGNDVNHFFVTSPPTGTAKATRLWVLGDSGTADSNARAVRDAFLGFTGTRDPDLMIMLGDNAYNEGTQNEYQAAVFNMYPTTLRNTPLWATVGNHDARSSANSNTETGPYYEIFTLPRNAEAGGTPSGTEAYYSFDYGNIHFVCLESYEIPRSATGAMMTWLENDMSANLQPWVIAYWHHPPYSKGSHNSDSERQMVDMRVIANPILERWGVDMVLTGHSHAYERSFLIDGHYGTSGTLTSSMVLDSGDGRPAGNGAYQKPAGPSANDGAVYIVAGSSGKISGGSLNHPAMFISLNQLGSMVIDVNGDQLDASFLRSNGAVTDSFTIMKGPGAPPVISGVTATDLTDTSARIAWTTDKSANSLVDYGLTTAYGLQASDANSVTAHSVNLAGLANNSTYHYKVTSTDSGGQATSSADFTFSTLPVNHPPVAGNDSGTTDEDTAITLAVLSNDSDPDTGDVVSLGSVGSPTHGTVVGNANGTVTYTPAANFNGNDSFTYTATDGKGGNDVATVTLTVFAVNDAPVANSQTVEVVESTSVAINLTATDVDDPAPVISLAGQPSNGSLTGTVPNLTYTPNNGFIGNDSFTFEASDGSATSNIATVSISVVAAGPLEANNSGNDKIEVAQGLAGAQSFSHGSTGDSDYTIRRVVLYLSRDNEAPSSDLSFSIGTGVNAGTVTGSQLDITSAQVSNTSEGSSFTAFEIAFPSAVGPFVAGTSYYLNLESGASNGKKYYLQYNGSNTYPRGTYYKDGSNDGKDIRFQIWGGSITTQPVCGNNVIETGELCDGSDLGGESCVSQGFGGGALACNASCSAFDTSACTPAGSCLHSVDFESGAGGWTQGADTCSTGAFVLGTPDATTWQVGSGAGGSANAFFTAFNPGGSIGAADVDLGTCEALSPTINAGAEAAVSVSFDYFHGQRDAGDDATDGLTVEVLNNGAVVQTMVGIGDVTNNPAWTRVSTTINNPGNLQLRVRATDGSSTGDIVEAGIDNVEICPTAPVTCTVKEDFEGGAAAWVNSAASTCSTGDFVVGTPSAQSASGVTTQVAGDHTSGGGNALFTATNSSAGNADVDGGVCILESPTWNVAAASDLAIWYFHGQRTGGGDPSGDFFRLEVSTDGGATYSSLVSIGDASTSAAWAQATAAIPAGSNVKLRLQVSDGTTGGDIVEGGIDDLSICTQ